MGPKPTGTLFPKLLDGVAPNPPVEGVLGVVTTGVGGLSQPLFAAPRAAFLSEPDAK
jgi:hypothetical protein